MDKDKKKERHLPAIKVGDKYICPHCKAEVPMKQNCPTCKMDIDWSRV
jgi:primosomal protein N'